MLRLVLLAVLCGGVIAIDNGLGLTPPMGWRSWNCYGRNVNQAKMESIMDKMTQMSRIVDGKATSLKDLGYVNCGLDDNWQSCGKGAFGSFHDAEGNPIINKDLFPDMKAMTDYAHARGLRAGWYMNNCICSEHSWKGDENITKHMEASAKAVAKYGFDGVKLDGCGQFRNLTWWAALLNATGRHILIENCHWGGTVPGQSSGDGPCSGTTTPSNCPYNFFRTSGDIRNNWDSMHRNLQTTKKYQGNPPLARPGTWAYPDMMEVGRMANYNEDRAHFGAWVITSSPLILGYDLNDESITDKIWDLISNKEAIAVNQAWAGHPGSQVKTWTPTPAVPSAGSFVYAVPCDDSDATQAGWSYDQTAKAVKGPGGKCLDASNAVELELKPCDGSAIQQFTLDDDGTLNSVAKPCYCVDIYGGSGPAVQIYKCHGAANEKFSFESSGHMSSQGKLCLAGRASKPVGNGDIELWMKPLGGGKVAAFLINSGANTTASFNLTDIGVTGEAQVRDLWARKDLATAKGTFAAKLGEHDSALITFSPVSTIVV